MNNFDYEISKIQNKHNKVIKDYISETDWRVKENSNTNYSFAGLQGHLAQTDIAKYALDTMYKGKIAEAHKRCFFIFMILVMLTSKAIIQLVPIYSPNGTSSEKPYDQLSQTSRGVNMLGSSNK